MVLMGHTDDIRRDIYPVSSRVNAVVPGRELAVNDPGVPETIGGSRGPSLQCETG